MIFGKPKIKTHWQRALAAAKERGCFISADLHAAGAAWATSIVAEHKNYKWHNLHENSVRSMLSGAALDKNSEFIHALYADDVDLAQHIYDELMSLKEIRA